MRVLVITKDLPSLEKQVRSLGTFFRVSEDAQALIVSMSRDSEPVLSDVSLLGDRLAEVVDSVPSVLCLASRDVFSGRVLSRFDRVEKDPIWEDPVGDDRETEIPETGVERHLVQYAPSLIPMFWRVARSGLPRQNQIREVLR